jgi:hypothetical protein
MSSRAAYQLTKADLPVRHRSKQGARLPPDFLLERIDGAKEPHEVKGSQFINNPNIIRKHKAARNWCRKRGMYFVVITK